MKLQFILKLPFGEGTRPIFSDRKPKASSTCHKKDLFIEKKKIKISYLYVFEYLLLISNFHEKKNNLPLIDKRKN